MKHPEIDSNTIRVGTVRFQTSGFDGAVKMISDCATNKQSLSVRFGNAYTVGLADRDQGYSRLIEGGVNYPDGVPVAWTMALTMRSPRWRRLHARGPSVFREMLEKTSHRHYLLGTTVDTLGEITARLATANPNAQIAGLWAPPFGPITDELIHESARKVSESGADIVWVGLGSPKQDEFTTRLAPLVQRPCVGVGAAFDFYGGVIPEPPRVLHGSGLEWLHRLAADPRRLIHRYTLGNRDFARAALKGLRWK